MNSLAVDASLDPTSLELIADQRARSGVLMFSLTMELLHMNQEALSLSNSIHQGHTQRQALGVLPAEVMALTEDIAKLLKRHSEAKEWEHFELRRMTGVPHNPVALRGFGLPDRQGSQPRILILMDRISLRVEPRVGSVLAQYQLTEREEEVLKQLAKGFTNKEIANELHITENTVKEHVKRLMQKMSTTTRTGLLSRILHAASPLS